MKNNGSKKSMSRRTALLAMVLAVALCISLVTGCGAKPTESADPQPISGQIEQTEPAKPIQPVEPAERTSPTEPTTTAEPAEAVETESTDEFSVKITELGDGAFRMEDASFTPGLDLTVTVPHSWAGRYTYKVHDTGITFYCKAVQDETDELPGVVCGFFASPEGFPLEYSLDGLSAIATCKNYSTGLCYTVMMSRPTDVQCTRETEKEFMSMGQEIDTNAVKLSPEMERSTWNETNWMPGTVSFVWDYPLDWNLVVCDGEASAAIREILESRTYTEGTGITSDCIIYMDGDEYAFDSKTGALFAYPAHDGSHYGVADTPLTAEELDLIHWVQEYGGTLRGEELLEAMSAANAYFEREAAGGMLGEHKMAFLKFIVSPDMDATTRCRERGDIGESDWAIQVTAIFVPENPDAINQIMAGNTHQYYGDDPAVPEGAWEYTRVGYVARDVNAWHVEIVGTGW